MANKINKNFWISASAGSGKTKTLIDRFLSLMMSGVAPQKILCVTFTRSAAAEMLSRITDELSSWVIMDDSPLKERLTKLLEREPSCEELRFARTCFANFLNVQDNVSIGTIHSFCQFVLNKFPFESGVGANYKVMDDRQRQILIDQTKFALLHDEELLEDENCREFITQINDLKLNELLEKVLFISSLNTEIFKTTDAIENYIKELKPKLSFKFEDNSSKQYLDQIQSKTSQCRALLTDAASSNIIFAIQWLDICNKPEDASEILNQLSGILLTKTGTPRKKLLTAKQQTQFPELGAFIAEVQELQLTYLKVLDSLDILKNTESFLKIGCGFLNHYSAVKRDANYLDYADLIAHCLNLLQDETSFEWVRRYLNDKFSHIMVDEAQDVNLDQWKLIRVLISEFCHNFYIDSTKTFFVVGDLKQSIYSFQGTSPYLFLGMEQSIKDFAAQFNIAIDTRKISQSFRSDSIILRFVDKVFEVIRANDPAHFFEEAKHISTKKFQNSGIEIWPAVLGSDSSDEDETDESVGWRPTIDTNPSEQPFKVLASKLAIKIKTWIDRGEYKPADIMILVRKRDIFMEQMIRELKLQNIAVSGLDRIILNQNIASEDLLALAKFILYPYDDYNLACLLKSPIFAVSEEQLFELCKRDDKILWQHMQQKGSEYCSLLRCLLENKSLHTPHALFSYVLDVLKMRTKFVARLGVYINQILDEFLDACLVFESDQNLSLTLFVQWFERGEFEIKQNFCNDIKDEVKIMTVHAAKGLESKVVILPDTISVPKKSNSKVLFDQHTGDVLYGGSNKIEFCTELSNRVHMQALQEYYRILYVALTRASERLLICSWTNRQSIQGESWYSILLEAAQQFECVVLSN